MGRLFDIEKIRKARVMVVGCGALGNEVLKNLVLGGVRHLVIVDFDRVEERNLEHSVLFTRRDAVLGRSKVEAAYDALHRLNEAVEIKTIEGDIAYNVGLGWVKEMDVVIGCVDSRWARYCINRLCMRAGKPWVDGGIAYLEGTARVFAPGYNCYACHLGEEGRRELQRHLSCADVAASVKESGHAPTTLIAASVIAAVEVQEAFKIIEAGKDYLPAEDNLLGRMFYYDGETCTTRTAAFRAWDEDCAEHELWPEPLKTDISVDTTAIVALEMLRGLSGGEPGLLTGDFTFVDMLENRRTLETRHIAAPSYKVDAEDFLSRGYDKIDMDFPYLHLSLKEIGFVPKAIIKTYEERGVTFVQLA